MEHSYDEDWADITASIDAGKPVAGCGHKHGYVITGYEVTTHGHRIMSLNDPARDRTQSTSTAARATRQTSASG